MSLSQALADGAVMTKRNLLKIGRLPDLLVFSTIQPIMFVLLFAYIFGSAIQLPGMSYREFLIRGIFVQTVIFGATITGSGLADDIKKGIIERFRSLPISSSAVLIGRTTSDLLNNTPGRCDHGRYRPARGLANPLLVPGGVLAASLCCSASPTPSPGSWRRSGLSVKSVEVVQQRLVHLDLPADLHRQHVRA